jgi:hypothetical protein
MSSYEYFFIPSVGNFERKILNYQLSLDQMQTYVGGRIKIIKIDQGFVICDEDAERKNKDYNATISWLVEADFRGDVIFTKYIY